MKWQGRGWCKAILKKRQLLQKMGRHLVVTSAQKSLEMVIKTLINRISDVSWTRSVLVSWHRPPTKTWHVCQGQQMRMIYSLCFSFHETKIKEDFFFFLTIHASSCTYIPIARADFTVLLLGADMRNSLFELSFGAT